MKYLQGAGSPGATQHRRRSIAVLGVPVLALAGVFGSMGATAAQSPAASSEPAASGFSGVTLTLETFEDAATIDGFKTALQACTDPLGITFNVVDVPGSGAAIYPGKVRTELVGGSGPDLWRIWGGSLGGPFATGGFAQDLSSYITQYGWNTAIPQAAIDGGSWNGTPYLLPLYHGTIEAFYDKAAFDKAGIAAPPTTYDELIAANDKLVAAGIVPFGTGGKFGWHVMRLFEYLLEKNAGPELHDQLISGQVSWDGNPAVIQAFTDLKTWADKGYMPKDVMGLDPTQEEPGVANGKYAYTIAGAWVNSYVQQAGKDPNTFGAFVLPTDQTPLRHSGFIEGWMINSQSANKDAAAAVLNCMAQPAFVSAAKIGNSTLIAAKPDPATEPLLAANVDLLNGGPFYTIQDQALPAEQANGYFDVQSKVVQGSMTPAEAATQMQAVMSTLQQ